MIDGRNFYDQPISSDERQYDELRKVTLGKGDNYTTGCLLDYVTILEESKETVLEFFKGTAKII